MQELLSGDPLLRLGLAVGLGTAGVLWAALLATVLVDGVRFWPPGERDWRLWVNWGLVVVFDAAAALVVLRSWDTWVLPRHPAVLVAAVGCCLGGAALAVVAAAELTPEETMGLDGDLRTGGLYRRTRNPQYLGMVLALLGATVLVNSLPATLLLVVNAGWLLLRPLAEERALREHHGEAYERYCERVPRFVGLRTLGRETGE